MQRASVETSPAESSRQRQTALSNGRGRLFNRLPGSRLSDNAPDVYTVHNRLVPRGAVAVIVAFLVIIGVTGCASAPPLKQVLLAPPETHHVPPEQSNWQVAVVTVPNYLDSYHIRYRSSDFVIDELPNAKWAQRLPSAITALLQSTIDSKLETNRDRPYRVKVTIATFAPQPSGKVVLSARWRVNNRDTGESVAHDSVIINKPLTMKDRTPETIGQTMSQTVRNLAYQVVAEAG